MVCNSHLVMWHVACVGLTQVQHLVDFANKTNYYREEKCDDTMPS